MNKKIVVISTSIRANSNSETLAKSFADGASYAGNKVELITLKDKQIGFCKGCLHPFVLYFHHRVRMTNTMFFLTFGCWKKHSICESEGIM